MKEELIKYVMEKSDECYSDDFPINNIQIWITEFFDQYQPEHSEREDLYLTLEQIENLSKDEIIKYMKKLEDIILRQYIQMSSSYICPKCIGCGALNTIET